MNGPGPNGLAVTGQSLASVSWPSSWTDVLSLPLMRLSQGFADTIPFTKQGGHYG